MALYMNFHPNGELIVAYCKIHGVYRCVDVKGIKTR